MDTSYKDQIGPLEDSYKTLSKDVLAQKALDRVSKMLMASSEFKDPRMNTIKKYWKLYDGKVDKKLRQLFNIPLPIFSGLIDTLNAQYDTPIQLEFKEGEPSDYFKAKKINAMWQREHGDTSKNTMWESKLRMARFHSMMTGRGILKYTAESDPTYKSIIDVVNLKNFHFQPKGGLWLENHLFAGEEGIEKTKSDLVAGAKAGLYDKAQVALILSRVGDKDYLPEADSRQKLERFTPLGLNPENNSFVGETVFRLAQFIFEMDGTRWYICFEPWTRTWLRFEKWEDIDSSGLYPWTTWATHEDDENFLSKAYSDDLYPVADASIALFNQEATNREKRNNSPRGYDKDMVMDVRKLDEAAYRPDALIPFDTKGGTRRISEGVYEFKTGELGGTINLLDWMKMTTATDIGTSDLSQGQVQNVSKKASVTFAEQKSVSRRLSWRAAPYQQMLSELGKRFIYGLKDHMPSSVAIKMIGDAGWDWDEITRLDLSTTADIDVKIVSTDKDIQESELEKKSRNDALLAIGNDPTLVQTVNPKWRAEQILRGVGGYDDVDVAEAMDTNTFGNKKSLAHASVAIQMFNDGKKPEMYYGADVAYMQKLIDVSKEKQAKNPKLAMKLVDFAMAHVPIVQQNMQQKAILMQQVSAQQQLGAGVPPPAGGASPVQPQENLSVPPGVSHAMNMASQV